MENHMNDDNLDGLGTKADAEERECRAEKATDEAIKNARVEVLTDCLEVAHECEGPSSSVYERIKERLEDAKAGVPYGLISDVAVLEERFAEDPDNEKLRRELHVARVKAGWTEFKIDTASGVDPRSVIPWVSTSEVTCAEEWAGPGDTPDQPWLRPVAKALAGGRVMKIGNHRICDDGKWRRDLFQEFDVVAVEDLAHLCSIVTRMEDVIVYKPDATGLMLLTIFDQGVEN